jgi:hypothetical protein
MEIVDLHASHHESMHPSLNYARILQKSLRNWPSIVFLPKRSETLPLSPRDLFIYFPKFCPWMPRRPLACHASQKSPTHAFHANIICFTPWHTPSACHSASHAGSFRCKSHKVLIYLRSVQCVEVINYASQNSSIACHATILRDTPKWQRKICFKFCNFHAIKYHLTLFFFLFFFCKSYS